ncbi:MAG: hypothetical protein IT204_09370 [Fimbriimonadaceae bacterium]|nr:hypothetical protein [Fimbriimonadaceae bacterium]
MRGVWFVVAAVALGPAWSAVVLREDFEQFDKSRWTETIKGDAQLSVVDGGVSGRCLKIVANGGHGYLSRNLDHAALRGKSLTLSGMVKLVDCQMGAQAFATPKFHFGMRREGSPEVINAAERWTGSFDWTAKQLSLQVDDQCNYLVLDIGNQNGFGTFYVDNLVLQDDGSVSRPLSLATVCNSGRSDGVAGDGRGSFLDRGPLDLYGLPSGVLTVGTRSFNVPQAGSNLALTAVLLRGKERPQWPLATEPVPVGRPVANLLLLCAAAWATAGEVVARVEWGYADGEPASSELLAGRQIGNYDAPQFGEQWQQAWQGTAAGQTVGVGMAVLANPRPGAVVRTVRFVSAGAGVPIVLAAATE